MNMLASSFAQFINGIFANWQMILFVLLAVLLIVVIVFRKVKVIKFIGFFAVPVLLIVLSVSLGLAVYRWTEQEAVDFGVRWCPTIGFAAIVVFHTWINSWRGLRKSLILLLHSVVVGAVCIIAYAVLIKVPEVDAFMLKFADMLMGGSGSLQKALGVNATCYGLKDVFVCWLPTVLQGDFSVMLGGSAAYVYTLADLIYHVAFAWLLLSVYYILIFIMYIVYHICYSERKYKRKITAKYAENKVDRRYSRHIVGGGVVGIVRGVAIGLLSLSFAGTSMYILAGRGEGKLKDLDYDFGNDNINAIYSLYRSIDSYGTYGIYKVLNAISSTDDVPYYLFAADLVFSGELEDLEFGISDHIVFREELDAYRAFAVDTMALLIKYGGDEIRPLINGTATENAFNTVLKVMSDEGFRYEFNDLISEFDTQTYIINFALSFVNSAIKNIDSMSFASSLSEDNRELLKILFTKGYMSDYIPDERQVNEAKGEVGIIYERPYINISRLVTKQDAQALLNIVLDVLTTPVTTVNESINLVGKLIPEIKSLSVLSADRTKEFDPVLGRLYCYAANRYLSEEGSEGVTYAEIYEEKIEWIGEINSLIDVADSALKLYYNIYAEGKQPQEMVLQIFDKTDKNYKDNSNYYDAVCDSIIKSRILGKALATSYIYNNVLTLMRNAFGDAYLPKDTVYESKFNADGELVSAGETYLVLNAVRILGRNTDLLSLLGTFDAQNDIGKLVSTVSDALTVEDENGKTIANYFVQSNLLRSVMSAVLINTAAEYVYVPSFARETDDGGERVCYISQDELNVLLESFSSLSDLILPVIDGGDAMDALIKFTHSDTFDNLLESSAIFEGTMGKLLVGQMGNDATVIIPAALKTELDGWASETGRTGEIKRLLNSLKVLDIEIDELADAFDVDKVVNNVLALTVEQLDEVLKSSTLHYTLSNQLINGMDFGSFSLIVPIAAQHELVDDSISGIVKSAELKCIIKVLQGFNLDDDIDISRVLVKLVENKAELEASYILSASVAYSLVNDATVNGMLTIPQTYEVAAGKDKLLNLNSSNPWKREIVRLIDALDDIMGISTAENFTFDEDALKDSLSGFLREMNEPSAVNGEVTRLTLCYSSYIIACSITEELDEKLDGKVEASLLSGAKSTNGNYTETELSSLSSALNIFDIDVMNIDADALADKVKGQLLELNEPAEGYGGKSTLDVIYPSVIISGMLSNELDSALLDGEDEDGEPAPMIDGEVLATIKNGKRYSQTEISQLITSIKEFGITSFDDIADLDLNDITSKQDKIDDICQSRIIKGVFTYQIRKNNSLGVDHPSAYESDIKILKTQEIKSLVKLIDKVNGGDESTDIEQMYFDDIQLAFLKEAIYEDDDSVKSYLVLSAVSDCILRNSQLLVNTKLVDHYKCVDEKEVLALIYAFAELEGEEASIGSWSNDHTGFDYPKAEDREVAFRSQIVRAKITEQIITTNASLDGGSDNYIAESNFIEYTDYRTGDSKREITELQLNCIFANLDKQGNTFAIPAMNLGDVKTMYNTYLIVGDPEGGEAYVKMVYDADVLRYKICDQILQSGSYETTEERAVNLIDGSVKIKSVLTFEQFMKLVAYK